MAFGAQLSNSAPSELAATASSARLPRGQTARSQGKAITS
jgi:hypothetical protein